MRTGSWMDMRATSKVRSIRACRRKEHDHNRLIFVYLYLCPYRANNYYYVSFQYERKSNHIKYESFFPFPKILFINSYKIFFCCIVYIRILIIIFMNIYLY